MSNETRSALLDLGAHLVALFVVGIPVGAAAGFVVTFGIAWIAAPEYLLAWIYFTLPLGIIACVMCAIVTTSTLGGYLSRRLVPTVDRAGRGQKRAS